MSVIARASERDAAELDTPETRLWTAVIQQAHSDLTHSDDRIRTDALRFFTGRRVLWALAMAGCDLNLAETLRAEAWRIAAGGKRARRPYNNINSSRCATARSGRPGTMRADNSPPNCYPLI